MIAYLSAGTKARQAALRHIQEGGAVNDSPGSAVVYTHPKEGLIAGGMRWIFQHYCIAVNKAVVVDINRNCKRKARLIDLCIHLVIAQLKRIATPNRVYNRKATIVVCGCAGGER